MKNLFLTALFFSLISAQGVQASEVRNLSATCTSKDGAVSLSFFAHSDILKSGALDLLVKTNGNFAATYLINDITFQGVKGAGDFSHVFFTDGDITLDLTIDNDRKTGVLVMDSEGTKIELACRNTD